MESKDDPPSGDAPRPPGPDPPAPERSEPELIAACISKQRGALEELVRRFDHEVRTGADEALASRSGRVSVTSEDLVQAFWCDVAADPAVMLGRFDGTHPLAPWLNEVAFNHSCNVLRSKKVRWPGRRPIRELPKFDVLPEPVPAKLHHADLVELLLERLEKEPREIIQARFGLGEFENEPMKIRELAEKRGWSARTLMRHLSCIFGELRILMDSLLDE